MLKTKKKLVGKGKSKALIKGKLNNAVVYVKPSLEDLEVTPTKEVQTFAHDDYYGYDNVKVNAIPNEYIIPDGTLEVAENGDVDVTNFKTARIGVYVPPNLQDKSITITENGIQNITYDEGYDGLNNVEVTTNIESSGTKITNLEELDNAIISCANNLIDYYTECINQYECDSNGTITLYTPAEGFEYYLTRYRNGTYQVLWFSDLIIKERSSSLLNTLAIQVYSFNIDSNSVGVSGNSSSIYVESSSDAYLSPTYQTLEELINAMQDSTTVYTSTSGSSWGVHSQSPTLAPYTNMVYLDSSNNMVMRKRISSNEKIEVISN